MTRTLNNIVATSVLCLTAATAYVALWAPLSLTIDDRRFLVLCALAGPSVGALVLYFLNQETR